MPNPIEKDHQALSTLYGLDMQLHAIQRIKGRLPEEIQNLSDSLKNLKDKKAETEKALQLLQEQVSTKSQADKESSEKLTKYNAQKDTITNEREFNALMQEIEFEEVHQQLLTKQLHGLNQQVQAKEAAMTRIVQEMDTQNEALKEKEAELNTISARYAKQVATLTTKQEKAIKLLSAFTQTRYTQLQSYRPHSPAIALVERNACSGCHLHTPPALSIRVAEKRSIVECEHCGRILIHPPAQQ